MMDTVKAVRWSKQRIGKGGLFAMDDFIGPSRFQWTERALSFANDFRDSLPASLAVNPNTNKRAGRLGRPTIEGMIALDPSEAADSDSIMPALREFFPTAQIIRTGGAIYHTTG